MRRDSLSAEAIAGKRGAARWLALFLGVVDVSLTSPLRDHLKSVSPGAAIEQMLSMVELGIRMALGATPAAIRRSSRPFCSASAD